MKLLRLLSCRENWRHPLQSMIVIWRRSLVSVVRLSGMLYTGSSVMGLLSVGIREDGRWPVSSHRT